MGICFVCTRTFLDESSAMLGFGNAGRICAVLELGRYLARLCSTLQCYLQVTIGLPIPSNTGLFISRSLVGTLERGADFICSSCSTLSSVEHAPSALLFTEKKKKKKKKRKTRNYYFGFSYCKSLSFSSLSRLGTDLNSFCQ